MIILLYGMPILILFIILIEKSKKQNINSVENYNQGAIQNELFWGYIYRKNKWIWIKTAILAIILVPIYISIINDTSSMGMAVLALPFILAPFILSFVAIGIVLIVKLISAITEFYYPNQKKFHIPGWIIVIIIIFLFVLNFATPFIRKYFRQSNQTNQNTQVNSQINNEAPPYFVKATFRIKDTNETFSYIENYVPNVDESYDYDQNAVSNCISWDLQGDFLCKKVYFIENGSDKKRLAIYDEKSDAVIGKIGDVLLFSDGKLVTELPNPHKIDDLVSYAIDYKFNGENYRIQRPENLCKDDNGKVVCHEPSFKIKDQVITFHISGLRTNNLYGIYPVDKVIETEMINYQEYKYGEVSPIVNVK